MTATQTSQLLLIDNDAFVLLAGAGHLDKVLAALGFSLAQCRYNGTLPFVFKKKIAKGLPAAVVERVNAALAVIRPLDIQPSASIQNALLQEPEIDAGEAVLFGVLAEHEGALLTTNDKRALRALSGASALTEVRNAVAGRIIAIEAIVKHLVEVHTVAAVASGFVEMSVKDKFLASVFTEHTIAHPEQCLEAIESYLAYATKQCGNDFFRSLAPPPR